MDSLGISTAMLSVTMPGARVFQGSNARALARQMNENIASVCGENPDRFGFFVNLPDVLLDTAGALEEIRYGLDVLKADGVILFTRYGDGNTYLGNPNIEAIWEELNKHNAVVLVHPSNATEKVVVNPRLPHLLIEGPHETTRAAMDMIVSGTVRKFPDCKIVLCHAGGTLPWVIGRVLDGLDLFGILDPHQALQDFGRFYFELALSTKPSVVAMLRSLVSDQQILYGVGSRPQACETINKTNHFISRITPITRSNFASNHQMSSKNRSFMTPSLERRFIV